MEEAKMTYSVMAKCPESGAVGLAMTSATINTARVTPFVHGVLPTFFEHGFLCSLQAFVNPMLGYESVRLLENGSSFEQLEAHLKSYDACWDRRQVGILKVSGEVYAHTGENCFPDAAHIMGEGYLVLGNVMAEGAIPAMAEAFEGSEGDELAERLMSTLEAGKKAGGQELEGEHLAEYASSLAVYDGKRPYPAVDLRVDFDLDAVGKLRRLLTHITGEQADKWFETLFRGEMEEIDPTWLFETAGKQI
jgi:uncharacterized Ntn-hydrolase superfamily protein